MLTTIAGHPTPLGPTPAASVSRSPSPTRSRDASEEWAVPVVPPATHQCVRPHRPAAPPPHGRRPPIATIATIADIGSYTGQQLGVSDWLRISQDRVNAFADATGDHQWIHVDAERATRESPFGGPIAHGYLTLSLVIPLWRQVLTVTDAVIPLGYGVNKVRFPAPLPVGSRIRLTATLTDVEEISNGVQVTITAVIEREGSDNPVCIAEPVLRFLRG
jgi:acyl dehydratase